MKSSVFVTPFLLLTIISAVLGLIQVLILLHIYCMFCSWCMHFHVQAVLASEHDHRSWFACDNGCFKALRRILWGWLF